MMTYLNMFSIWSAVVAPSRLLQSESMDLKALERFEYGNGLHTHPNLTRSDRVFSVFGAVFSWD